MFCCEKPDCQDIHCPGRPAKVANVKHRVHLDPIYPSIWREQLRALARWVLLGLLAWLVFGALTLLALYA